MIDKDTVVAALGNMSVMELISMTKQLEEKWGLKALPQPSKIVLVPTVEVKAVVVQTEFNVVLVSYPADKKMSLIKCVRDIMGLGLKETKEAVEAAPKTIKEGVSKDDAEEIKRKITEAGGLVSIQ